MQTYRILVRRHGRLLGHMDLAAGASAQDRQHIAACFAPEDGYALSLLESAGERRLLESTPAGIRLLVAEPLYRPAPDALTPAVGAGAAATPGGSARQEVAP